MILEGNQLELKRPCTLLLLNELISAQCDIESEPVPCSRLEERSKNKIMNAKIKCTVTGKEGGGNWGEKY